MAKQKLFPEPPKVDEDTRKPHERFRAFAGLVVATDKKTIDQREDAWKRERDKPATT
jgi:hypothetical protein